ncbi:hypothetical protein Q5752_005528 [Cryptotrichosporon argae]
MVTLAVTLAISCRLSDLSGHRLGSVAAWWRKQSLRGVDMEQHVDATALSRSHASSASSVDSLFDEPDDGDAASVASTEAPPIPGLYVFPSLLDSETAHAVLAAVAEADHFAGGTRDQAMLFTSAPESCTSRAPPPVPSSLPSHITDLIASISALLGPHLPAPTHAALFAQPLARQVILNLYPPGAGIAPHVDLPHRYADGIVGVSLTGSCVMRFTRVGGDGGAGAAGEADAHDVHLPPRSVYVMTGESRWAWAHGIAPRVADRVAARAGKGRVDTVLRGVRVSVTMRWMRAGADVLS